MRTKPQAPTIEEMLSTLGAHAIDLIHTQGPAMDAEISNKTEELKHKVWTGYSNDGVVKVRMDGQYHMVDIAIDPKSAELSKDQAHLCALITEAVNDAIYTVELNLNAEISNIQYRFSSALIGEVQQPSEIKDKYKKVISDVKRK